jgi:hypothetical protein
MNISTFRSSEMKNCVIIAKEVYFINMTKRMSSNLFSYSFNLLVITSLNNLWIYLSFLYNLNLSSLRTFSSSSSITNFILQGSDVLLNLFRT